VIICDLVSLSLYFGSPVSQSMLTVLLTLDLSSSGGHLWIAIRLKSWFHSY